MLHLGALISVSMVAEPLRICCMRDSYGNTDKTVIMRGVDNGENRYYERCCEYEERKGVGN
jgi:hypothetical protein